MVTPNPQGYSKPIGPWERRLPRGVVRQIDPAELRAWMVHEDERLLVINKPGDVVCHPSKEGPWSSLAGAVREYLGGGAAHLIFRLDRETSGLVVFAKDAGMARRLQMAAQEKAYDKRYLVVLTGELDGPRSFAGALGPDRASVVQVKSTVVTDGSGQPAVTHFTPCAAQAGFTLASVVTESGRKHQIRAHAQALGYPVVGDKIYGPDARWFLEFIECGWTASLQERLLLPRQALHCLEIDLRRAGVDATFFAPLAADLVTFCRARGIEVPGWALQPLMGKK